jgi:AraC-like DNA-binding protein
MVKPGVICYIDFAMHVEPCLPLSQYQLFHTQDVDEARDCVARIFCPHGLHTTAPRRALDARHHSVRLHQDVRLNYVQYGPEVDIDPGYLGDFYLLQLPLRGGAEVRCGGQQVTAHAQMASLPSPSEPLRMRWADDSPHLIVRFSQAAVHRQWEQLAQAPLVQPLVFGLGVNLQETGVSPMLDFIKYLCATVDTQPGFAGSALAAQAEAYLVTSLLTLLPHSHSAKLKEDHSRSVLPRSVWRAQEYMRQHADAPVSLADLCAVAGVSVRSLQTAFQTHTGQSPMAYWRGVRLDGARALLLSAESSAVGGIAQVAARFGFLHQGHFAEHYRLRFGETPAMTLKSRRKRTGLG